MEIILNKIFFIIFKQQTCNFYKKNPVSYFYTWYIRTFIYTFMHTFIRTLIYTFIQTFIHTYVLYEYMYYKGRKKKYIINTLMYFYLKNSFAATSYIFLIHFVTLFLTCCPHRIVLVTSRLVKDSMSS